MNETKWIAKVGRMERRPVAIRVAGFLTACLLVLLLAAEVRGAEGSGVKPGPEDKCPVCGMLVAPFPNWWAAVVFKDGSRAFFDGPRDMFKYLLDLKKYNPSEQTADIAAVYVTDYYSVSRIDGRKAWYVTGSDVNGPMGEELVPFEKESDARGFLKDHKGKSILAFESIHLDTVSPREGEKSHGGHE